MGEHSPFLSALAAPLSPHPAKNRQKLPTQPLSADLLMPMIQGTARGLVSLERQYGRTFRRMEASMKSQKDDSLLTPAEVAALFRVDPKTVTRWAKAGKLSSIRTLGGHRRYRADEVKRFLEAARQHQV